jgi:hypothetical protein
MTNENISSDLQERSKGSVFSGGSNVETQTGRESTVPLHYAVCIKTHVLHLSHCAECFEEPSGIHDLFLIDSLPANLPSVQPPPANRNAVFLVSRAFSTSRKSLEKAARHRSQAGITDAIEFSETAQSSTWMSV